MLDTISPKDAYDKVAAGTAKIIDIRDAGEYAELHIKGAQLIPAQVLEIHPVDADKELIFTCRSGKRTEAARALLERVLQRAQQTSGHILDGGLQGWEKAGLPIVHMPKAALPMFRQIQIAAGSLVLLGVIGSALWHPFYLLTAFVGAGLVFAGLTGFCGMGLLLAKMPWNKKG